MSEITTGNNKAFGSKLYTFSLTQKDLVPKFKELTSKDWVYYGEKNTYPLKIVDAYNSSALFKAIVQLITHQVKGLGLRIKDGEDDARLQAFIDMANSKGESLHDVFAKVVLDYVLFNGFTSSVIYKRDKSFELYHTDYSAIRSAKYDAGTTTVSKYYFSNDWSKYNPTVTQIPAFNINNRSGTQIYNFHTYSPNNVYYPVPRYSGAFSWITLDIRLAEFFNSYLESGCFPGFFVNLNNGQIDSEEKAQAIVNEFLHQFEGSAKAGRVIVSINQDKEHETTVTPIQSNDDDKKFEYLSQYVLQQIVSGFNLSSPELAGIPSGNKLGAASDLSEAQQQFNNKVVEPIQNEILKEINFLLKANGFENQVEVIPTKQVVTTKLGEGTLTQICTINELRSMIGKEPLPEGGDVLPNKSGSTLETKPSIQTPKASADSQGGTPTVNDQTNKTATN